MRKLVLALCALPWLPSPALGQDPMGPVGGFVYDSTTGEALTGARVILWGTSFQTETDDSGAFRFREVPLGEYSAVFFHPRLAHLGISSGMQTITVGEGGSVDLILATPSMSTILANNCLLDTGDPAAANVAGQVLDAGMGVGMPRARVTLRWMEGGRPRQRPVDTDGEGWFRACDLPQGIAIAATATFIGMSSPRREFELAPSQTHRVDFPLAELDQSDVTGTITDLDSGQPVRGAEIRLRDADFFTVSDEQGSFRLREVPPGEYTLIVTDMAHATRTQIIHVGSGVGVDLGIVMATEAIELEPIIVTIEAKTLAEQFATGGLLISSEDLAPTKERVTTLVDLLFQTQIPGLTVRRAENDICAQFGSGQVRFMKSGCESATFYIDGARQVSADVLMDLSDDIVDRIVVYRPVEAGALFGTGGSRGVIMIYTKGGARRLQRR